MRMPLKRWLSKVARKPYDDDLETSCKRPKIEPTFCKQRQSKVMLKRIRLARGTIMFASLPIIASTSNRGTSVC